MTRPETPPDPGLAAAIRLARAGRQEDALAALERVIAAQGPGEPGRVEAVEALSHVARLCEAARVPTVGVRALDEALRLRPGYPDLHYRRARLLLQLHHGEEARRALDRALALNPRYTAARLERALLDAAEGFIGEALEALRELSRDTAVEEPRAFQAGLESLERADWEEAGALLSRALQLEGAEDGSAVERARALLQQGEEERAAELLHDALPGCESWPDLHYVLGSAELRRGHFDDALASLARALELNPDFHAARVQFALALEALGASVQAAEQVALVLQSDPGHPQALELHQRWTSRGRHAARAADAAGPAGAGPREEA